MPEIIYEDNHLLIAVKPPNQLTQSDQTGDSALHDELKEYIARKYQKPGAVYLGLVHRLDRPVGGLVAFGRTSKAASRLSEQLRNHQMNREYLAVVENGSGLPQQGSLENYLRQDEKTMLVKAVSSETPGSQKALLHFCKLAEDSVMNTALVFVQLETGRKHQIRVQLSDFGHPIVFDARYGKEKKGYNIALWGSVLKLSHPTTHRDMCFVSEPRGDAFQSYQKVIHQFLKEVTEKTEGEDL